VTPRETDFYEYYWADKPADTKLADTLLWLALLLTRLPTKRLAPLWILSWVSLAIFVVFSYANVQIGFRLPTLIATLLSGCTAFALNWFLVRYLGDAARYFHPGPSNFEFREEVMQKGFKLLKSLSESGRYDRIVVVGHSLGSVIAYDVLQQLWARDFWKIYKSPRPDQPALKELEATGQALQTESTESAIIGYQEKQIALWREMRALGNPWRITDFITLGSPMTYAPFLMHGDFDVQKREGKLQTDPPAPLDALQAGPDWNLKYKTRVLGRDQVFAFTRWTNLYFPAYFGLFGDLIGGPLRPQFGPGIRDRAVAVRNVIRRYTPFAHVSYLSGISKQGERHELPMALAALIEALDLNAERLGIPRNERPMYQELEARHRMTQTWG
jgi:hypothetical protein